MSERLKNPWQMAVEWYGLEEIIRSVAALENRDKVPKDTTSREFAVWITEQYRLAMAKGIQIGRGESEAEIERLKELNDATECAMNDEEAAHQETLQMLATAQSQPLPWTPASNRDQCTPGEQYVLLTIHFDSSIALALGFAEKEDGEGEIVFEDEDGEQIEGFGFWMPVGALQVPGVEHA